MPRPDQIPDPSGFGAPMPKAALPLQGLTLLVVEDSRYASDGLRLLCQRSGARLRRADSLAAAAQHLRLYRPDVVIVDLGLPDGPGTALIRQLAALRGLVVLGSSGDPSRRDEALAAGAMGFLDKADTGLQVFQALILAHLPDARARGPASAGQIGSADPLALQDDLRTAGAALAAGPAQEERAWLAGFLAGLARQSQDSALAAAASTLRDPAALGFPALASLLRDRIDGGPAAFGARG